ncbi:hypothetical protein DXG03_006123 [Asterophora parasitica]|uniref:Uncharacterized protein n=1 Tax=Asterophora parasitica TaxID=117018 RepID=A0A9P7GGG7_9AGAR|nr:hypothetical protein DXG03_006123 [Asterophora parasitica]
MTSSTSTAQITVYAALVAASLFLGYVTGASESHVPASKSIPPATTTESTGDDSDSEESDTSSNAGDGDISLKVDQGEECKLVR